MKPILFFDKIGKTAAAADDHARADVEVRVAPVAERFFVERHVRDDEYENADAC